MKNKVGIKLNNRIPKLTAVIMMCMVVFSSCTTYNSFKNTFLEKDSKETEPTITIGVFEAQTGRNAKKGLDELKGIELANSIYSNVHGYRIILSKVDTQSSINATKTAVNGLLKMQPVAIIGASGDATSLAASELIEESRVPTITPSSTNPLITQGNIFYFRASLTESQMGKGLAEYAADKMGSTDIGIITLKNDSSMAAMVDGFKNYIKMKLGKTSRAVRFQTEISPTGEEMKDALVRMQSRGVNICLVPIPTERMDEFFTLVEERNMTNMTFLGNRSWGEPDFIAMMENHPRIKIVFPYESVMSGSMAASGEMTEEAERFRIEYENRYGSDDTPSYHAALGYDSYMILINAINNAKSLDGFDVRSALLELKDLKCSTGAFEFDDQGNVVRSVTLSTVKEGQVVSEYICKDPAEAEKLEDVEEKQEEN